MDVPTGSPDWLAVYTAAERPDLWQEVRERRLFEDVWPEYNKQGNHSGKYFSALYPRHAHLQVLLVDRRSDQLIARGRTIPLDWDGTLDDLPDGIDEAGLRALDESRPETALSALAAEVDPGYQGTGLSAFVIRSMAAVAAQAKLAALIAPVRPSWKDRYPLTAIDRYASWVRDDGLPFDPWMRVHARLGARILRSAPKSMDIHGPVEDWEKWTAMSFPEDGDYVFPGGLAPLSVKGGVGSYWEPNVWMLHEVGG
jgi:GNAT superfamily N-acetyltransferase